MLGVERDAVIIHACGHFSVIGRPAPPRLAKNAGYGGMACGNALGNDRLDGPSLHGQVLGQFIGNKIFPVDVVRVRQDGAVPGRLHFLPALEGPVPGFVQAAQGLVFHFEPFPEPRLRRRTITEFHVFQVAHVIDLGPVDNVGLAPEVPPQEGRLVLDDPGRLAEELENPLAHLRMVEAKPGRSLGFDSYAVRRHEFGVRVFFPDPFRGGVDINLDDDPKPEFPGEVDERPQGAEIILAFFRLAGGPLHPATDRIEPEALDLLQVFFPETRRVSRHFLKHRRPRLSSGIPDRNGKKVLVLGGSESRPGAPPPKQEKGPNQGRRRRFIGVELHCCFSPVPLFLKDSPTTLSRTGAP